MKRKALDRGFRLCLIGLLILRFPLLLLCYNESLPLTRETAAVIYQIGTYLLTTVMVLLKRDALEEYHIDRLALALLVFAPVGCLVTQCVLWDWRMLPLSTYVNAGLSVLFFLALLIWRPTLPHRETKMTLKWIGISVPVALCLSLVTGYLIHFQRTVPADIPFFPMIPKAVLLIFTQLATAAALEEPLFRGFLWGSLKARGWRETGIWLIQALLFTLGHLYYLGDKNYSFFLAVPLCALILGLVAWRSRSIGNSMIIHSVVNSLAGNLFILLWR